MKFPEEKLALGITATAIAIFTIMLSTFFFNASLNENSLNEIIDRGTITIGYAVEAPYAFLTPEGRVTGESPEIARKVARSLGIENIEWKVMEFGSLIENLERGSIDVIASGMFITPERSGKVNFSLPTFHVRQGLLVARNNPLKLQSYYQAANDRRVRVAVLAGSIEEKLFSEKLRMEDRRIIRVPDALTGRRAVESGLADALALSSPTVNWIAQETQLGLIESAEHVDQYPVSDSGYGAFAFRKQDLSLLKGWNDVLKKFVGSQDHMALISGFGFTPDELP